MVNALEQQGISVVLLGFTKPGGSTDLPSVKQYIEAQGGKVLQIVDGVNLVQYLTPAYSPLLEPIHPSFLGGKRYDR